MCKSAIYSLLALDLDQHVALKCLELEQKKYTYRIKKGWDEEDSSHILHLV